MTIGGYILRGIPAIMLFLIILSCGHNDAADRKLLILGIDGMDPVIYNELAGRGKMPAFERLASAGGYCRLWSSIPPQSPVAWANFITGMDPGGHGIFDFVHRKPETLAPYLSVSESVPPRWNIPIGQWTFPLRGGDVRNLRHGKAFWEILEENGIPTMILGIPSNFPPAEKGRSLSGMGTPDILGSYGEFTYFTSDSVTSFGDVSGGSVVRVRAENGVVHAKLQGPHNPFRKDGELVSVPLIVYCDSSRNAARIDIAGNTYILREGEWSEWIPLNFEMISGISSVSGICRIYLKEVHPWFKLYVSPININPREPAMPISYPGDFAGEIAEDIGYFYTQGMAEDTKAYEYGILNDKEFRELSLFILEERLKLLDWALKRFEKGVLFIYFSSLDLNGHMFYRSLISGDSSASQPEVEDNFLAQLYMRMDRVLCETMETIDNNTILMVMSDHGFAPLYTKFNLNTWLHEEGYVSMFREWDQEYDTFFQTVDWSRTRAYAVGLNGLYVNLKGRESTGIVEPEDREELIDEIAEKLLALRDPDTGAQIIKRVYRAGEFYHGPYAEDAPDLIVGYARGYRCSDESAMGEFPEGILSENRDKWGGDHCMAMEEVPGVLFLNIPIRGENPSLYDIAPSMLKHYNIEIPGSMVGSAIF